MKVEYDFSIGDFVSVSPSVTEPRFGWGEVRAGDVGIIKEVRIRNSYGKVSKEVIVDFPKQHHWLGDINDLGIVDESPQEKLNETV